MTQKPNSTLPLYEKVNIALSKNTLMVSEERLLPIVKLSGSNYTVLIANRFQPYVYRPPNNNTYSITQFSIRISCKAF